MCVEKEANQKRPRVRGAQEQKGAKAKKTGQGSKETETIKDRQEK